MGVSPLRGPGRSRPRSRSRFATAASRVAVVVSFGVVVASPSTPTASEVAVLGLVTDRDTGEAIEGAWIFEATPRGTRGADVRRFDRVAITRSDRNGAFDFSPASGDGFSAWLSSLFAAPQVPRYHVYHPSYGFVWGREALGMHASIALSLRDAHLRLADAQAFCASTRSDGARDGGDDDAMDDDAMREAMRRVACPPGRPALYANDQPRATGPLDARGRRHGAWVFHRSDGSIAAEGDYDAGAAVGDWVFHPKPEDDAASD